MKMGIIGNQCTGNPLIIAKIQNFENFSQFQPFLEKKPNFGEIAKNKDISMKMGIIGSQRTRNPLIIANIQNFEKFSQFQPFLAKNA